MSTCRRVRRWIEASFDGGLSLSREFLLEEHVRECPACRARAEESAALGESGSEYQRSQTITPICEKPRGPRFTRPGWIPSLVPEPAMLKIGSRCEIGDSRERPSIQSGTGSPRAAMIVGAMSSVCVLKSIRGISISVGNLMISGSLAFVAYFQP